MNRKMIDEMGLRRPRVEAVVVAPANHVEGMSTRAIREAVAAVRASRYVACVTVLTDSAEVGRALTNTVRVVAFPPGTHRQPASWTGERLWQGYASASQDAEARCFLGVGPLSDRDVHIDRAVDTMTVFDAGLVVSAHRDGCATTRPAALSPLVLNGVLRLTRARRREPSPPAHPSVAHVELTRHEAERVAPVL